MPSFDDLDAPPFFRPTTRCAQVQVRRPPRSWPHPNRLPKNAFSEEVISTSRGNDKRIDCDRICNWERASIKVYTPASTASGGYKTIHQGDSNDPKNCARFRRPAAPRHRGNLAGRL